MNISRSSQYVCRTCLKRINENEPYTRDDTSIEFGKIIDVLETCVSELNLDLTYDVVLCQTCTMMLKISYSFKLTCLHTEDAVFAYFLKHNLKMYNKIHLTDMIDNKPPMANPSNNKHVNKKVKKQMEANDEVNNIVISEVFDSRQECTVRHEGNEDSIENIDSVENVIDGTYVNIDTSTIHIFENEKKTETDTGELEEAEKCLRDNVSPPANNNSIDWLSSIPSGDLFNPSLLEASEEKYPYSLLGCSFTNLCDEDFEDVIFRNTLSEK